MMAQTSFLAAVLSGQRLRVLADVRDHEVPPVGGAYVLVADPGAAFRYPRGQSGVFYIGKASNLRRRLLTHARYIAEARDSRKLTLYWPRYEYGARFGARYTFVRTRGTQTPAEIEARLLARFAEQYRSWPVANGAGAWDSLRSLRQLATARGDA